MAAHSPLWRFPVVGFIVLVLMRAQLSRQDSIDDIRAKADNIARRASQRCSSVPNNEKVLPRNAISDLPLPFDPQGPIPEFRAAMYEAQKIAVNRAIFFSYIMQQADLEDQPDMGYYFYSTLATLSSSDDKLMGSKIVFKKDMAQNNWYGAQGNSTLPFFGPYAFKRFNTSQMLFAIDLGSDPSFSYYDETKHITPNPWFAAWLSERTAVDLPQPALLELKVLKDSGGVETINFFGPPVELPAIWTMPFFDCMFTDKWQLSVTAPIADLDRSGRILSKRQVAPGNAVNVQGPSAPASAPIMASYAASVSVELDYRKIDINQCDGDTQFNIFAGTHKCKKETTTCEPLSGHGLRRGGYQCVCKSGFKYPSGRNTPFSGGEVESASAADYARIEVFQCIPVQGQEWLSSPSAIAIAAQTAAVNAPVNMVAQNQPSRRPVNLEQQPAPVPVPQPSQVVQSQQRTIIPTDTAFPNFAPVGSLQQASVPVPELNTPSPAQFNTLLPQLPQRQTLTGVQQQPPVRPSPNFAPSPTAVLSVKPAAPQFDAPPQSPQFVAQNFNLSRAPQPSFAPQQQFFNPQFQSGENFAPAQPQRQPVMRPTFDTRSQTPQAAASRMDVQFMNPSRSVPEFNPEDPRFNQNPVGPIRRTRQVPAEVQAAAQQAPNAAVVQQLLTKLAQENNLMFRARQMLDSLSPLNCSASRFAEKVDLGFSQEFNRKIAKQFASQARSALRLSHFLSNYLQNGIPVDGKRRNKLTENMILGEMAAMIIAEPAIGAVSILFEDGVFPGRRVFAPTALYNKLLDELQFYHYPDNYTNFDWYRNLKTKAAATRLTDFAVDVKIRVDAAGSRFVDIPTQSFKAVNFDDVKNPLGPFYDCFYLDKFFWFEVPFFAKKSDGSVQFGGLLSVGINPDQIDVNQCASAEEPLFRGTDRCDRQSTTCVPVGGRGFRAGGYKCVCKEGFEYPYVDQLQYFDGLSVEIEYQNKLMSFPNNYDKLKCRQPQQKSLTSVPVPPAVPTAPVRQPQTVPTVSPATFAPAQTSTPKFSDENMAADNNPWIPNVPASPSMPQTLPTAPPTTTTTERVPEQPFNSFSPNLATSFGFDPNANSQEFSSQNPFQPPSFSPTNPAFEFTLPPQNVPTVPQNVPAFNGPNFGQGNTNPFDMVNQGQVPPQMVPMNPLDQIPSFSGNMPTLNTVKPNIPVSPTQFVPQFRPESTMPVEITPMIITPSTTSITTTSSTTTSTTTTTTTSTTTPTTTTTESTTTSTEAPSMMTLGTMATLEEFLDASSNELMTSPATARPSRHGPTKYTVKVIKNKDGLLAADAESTNEIKRERRIQAKKNGARRRMLDVILFVVSAMMALVL